MPYVRIESNVAMDQVAAIELAKKASAMVARAVGKPEKFALSVFHPNMGLTHGGSTEPAAFVSLKSIGLREEQCPELSKALCAFLEAELTIDPERVYIEFTDLKRSMFGWNNSTF